jgi:large subunit ribosomal protein L24
MLLRVDDEVEVIAGAEKGQRGKILKIDRERGRIVVEGLNKVYKHVRKSQRNQQGGRLSTEMPMDASNVMLICPTSGEKTRVGVRYLPDGSKERYSKKGGASLGQIAPPRKAGKLTAGQPQ